MVIDFIIFILRYGDRVSITIENDTRCVYRNIILFGKSFALVLSLLITFLNGSRYYNPFV